MIYDIVIFGGQSNMQGQAEKRLFEEPVDGALEYKYLDDALTPLKDPCGENISYGLEKGEVFDSGVDLSAWLEFHVAGGPCFNNTNPVPSFCGTYHEKTGRSVVAVHAAKGSTMVAHWLTGTPGYQVIREKTKGAIAKIKSDGNAVGHIFFVWLQGESDAVFRTSQNGYKMQLTHLKNALKNDIGIEKFGIIKVGRFTNDERDFEIMNAQETVCKNDSDFIMLTDIAEKLNTMPEYMSADYAGHFNSKGLARLGEAAAVTLAEYVEGKLA